MQSFAQRTNEHLYWLILRLPTQSSTTQQAGTKYGVRVSGTGHPLVSFCLAVQLPLSVIRWSQHDAGTIGHESDELSLQTL